MPTPELHNCSNYTKPCPYCRIKELEERLAVQIEQRRKDRIYIEEQREKIKELEAVLNRLLNECDNDLSGTAVAYIKQALKGDKG